MNHARFAVIAFMLGSATAAAARDKAPPPSPLLKNLADCRSIADSGARLACYDGAAKAIEDAAAKHDIVLIDREGVRQTKRSLFGFSLPRLPIFGDSGDDEKFEQIETTATSIRAAPDGEFLIVLADGARWRTTEGYSGPHEPRAGAAIKIRRGALGSYFMNIDRAPAVKAQRVN